MKKRATTTPPSNAGLESYALRVAEAAAQAKRHHRPLALTGGQRRAEEKRRRAEEQAERTRTRERSEANLPQHDSRTAAGRRDYEIQNLGGPKRARALASKNLFRRSEATFPRTMACDKYSLLVHRAMRGDYPAPKFEPGVDGAAGNGSDMMGVLESAQAKQQLTRLRREIGYYHYGLLYHRIILGMTFTHMESEPQTMGRKTLGKQFLAAVDAAAVFFRLQGPARVNGEISRLRVS